MRVSELKNLKELEIITKDCFEDLEIKGCFVGDLLSVVMGKANEGQAWITVQGHINIIAVASLVEMSCIIVSEGYEVNDDTIAKANEEEIVIFKTKLNSYQMACLLYENGIK